MKRALRPLRQAGRQVLSAAMEAAVATVAAFAARLPAAPAEPRSIFVLRNNDVGDLLLATPLFDALRRRFPQAWIAAGVGRWNLDVLRHNPHLSEVLTVDAPWFNKYQGNPGVARRLRYLRRSSQVREVAARRFEVGIDVLGSTWGSLLLLRAGIPWRMGMRGYAGGHSALQAPVDFDPGVYVGRLALRFAELLGATDLPEPRPQVFLTAEEREAGERAWATAEREGGRRRRVVVGPGGGLAVKRWPAESFAALTARLPQLEDPSILVLGGPGEEELVAGVAAAARTDRAWTFPKPPGLREVFALVAAADLVICNSSMLMHVAAAFACPTVVLLGEAFTSASAHQAQWGLPDLCRSLGREPGSRPDLATPAEALAAVQEAATQWRG